VQNIAVIASYEVVERLARERLPSDIAEKWIALLRPAARLRHARPGDQIVGELGGLPALTEDTAWPEWDGHGPLTSVGSIDCASLSRMRLDIGVPTAGRLAFFLLEYDPDALVTHQDPESLAGARVIFIPPGVRTTARPCPSDNKPYPHINLSAEAVATYPNFEHPALIRAFQAPSEDRQMFLEHPVNDDAFVEALWELEAGPRHQVGGYATPVQGPVEFEVAMAALGGKVAWSDPSLEREAARWSMLVQVDSDDDAKMMWGDVGMLYWMIRPADLEARTFEGASFTMQCH